MGQGIFWLVFGPGICASTQKQLIMPIQNHAKQLHPFWLLFWIGITTKASQVAALHKAAVRQKRFCLPIHILP